MTAGAPRDTPRLGTVAFLIGQILIVALGVAWASLRTRDHARERALPSFRTEPRTVMPRYDNSMVVTDEQLSSVLGRLGLRRRGSETNIGEVDHSLRFWGADVRFDDPEVLSGEEMRQLLIDHARFTSELGDQQRALLLDDGQAIRFRTQEGIATSSHYDHTLASLAEVGTPLDYPVTTPRRRVSLQAIFEQSLRDFSLNQAEYEWSALSYALYLQSVDRWFTSEGQMVSFDRLAERIMREELPRGVCSGSHRLYSLTMFLRLDDQLQEEGEPAMLSRGMRGQIMTHLEDATSRYVRHQHPDGFWNSDWPIATPTSSEPTDRPEDGINNRLIVTGHALEWWALAPRELHPPDAVLTAAGQWLVRTVGDLSDEEITRYYSFLSHVGRALSLWRGRLPSEVELSQPTAE